MRVSRQGGTLALRSAISYLMAREGLFCWEAVSISRLEEGTRGYDDLTLMLSAVPDPDNANQLTDRLVAIPSLLSPKTTGVRRFDVASVPASRTLPLDFENGCSEH